jgi:hypothetical protein
MRKEEAITSFDGWFAYAEFANTYNLRNRLAHEFRDLLSVNQPVQIPSETM